MWARTLCPLSSSTRKNALGSGSTTVPSISMAPSFLGMSSALRWCRVPAGPVLAGLGCLPRAPAARPEDLGEQIVAWREPEGELAAVADEAGGDGDEPPAQGGDHGLAAADAMTGQDVLASGQRGELVQPGGDVRGEQGAPHPGQVHPGVP